MRRITNDLSLDLSGAKILVVDDQVINIQAVNALLADDYTILIATSGEDALLVAKEQAPDLILMDVVMPGMTGKEACMALKAKEDTQNIPVIFITTVSKEKDEDECWESGGVDFIAKPYNPQTLKNRVRAHLELKFQKDMLMQLAYSDGLTGVFNRRYFDEHYPKLRRAGYRKNAPLSLLLMDIDYFKKYNDTYGHIAGDEVLIAVARSISSSLRRPVDFCARYGGEEFVVMLPDTNCDGAEHIANSIMQAVSALNIEHKASEHGVISLSIGIFCDNGDHLKSGDLLELADEALYEAKEQGRNRVVMYQAPSRK